MNAMKSVKSVFQNLLLHAPLQVVKTGTSIALMIPPSRVCPHNLVIHRNRMLLAGLTAGGDV